MSHLLDTWVLSDFARGEAGTLDCLKEMPPALIAVSSVTVMEIECGLALAPVEARRFAPVMHALFRADRAERGRRIVEGTAAERRSRASTHGP